MAQLPLHAGIPVLMILVSFRRTLTFILILRCVDARRFLGIPRHSSGFFVCHGLRKQAPSDEPLQQPTFSIRLATMNDSGGILSCLRAAFERYESSYTRGAYEDTVLTPESLQKRLDVMSIFVAISAAGEVVGTIAYHTLSPDEGRLRGMAVRPEWQGTGLAAALLHDAATDLRKHQCKRITIDTTD